MSKYTLHRSNSLMGCYDSLESLEDGLISIVLKWEWCVTKLEINDSEVHIHFEADAGIGLEIWKMEKIEKE